METRIVEEVIEQLKTLPEELQWRVLEFARSLGQRTLRGNPGNKLTPFAGAIPLDEIRLMTEAIEEGCERVNANEW